LFTSGVGSYSKVGGLFKLQCMFVWRKITFLWSVSKKWGGAPASLALPFFTAFVVYGIIYLIYACMYTYMHTLIHIAD